MPDHEEGKDVDRQKSPIKRESKQGKLNNHKYKCRFLQMPAKESTEQPIKPSTRNIENGVGSKVEAVKTHIMMYCSSIPSVSNAVHIVARSIVSPAWHTMRFTVVDVMIKHVGDATDGMSVLRDTGNTWNSH